MKALLTTSAVALLAAIAPVAKANSIIQIQYQIDTNAAVTCQAAAPGPLSCANANANGLSIVQLGANSNQPGNPAVADTASADVDLINNDSVAHTIQIQVSADGFTNPLGFGSILSNIGGTVSIGGAANAI